MTREHHSMGRNLVDWRHRARYEAFSPFFLGDVFDLGCGTGHGCAVIAASPRVTSVTLFDQHALGLPHHEGIHVVGVWGELPGTLRMVGPGIVDVVACVEFIEHIDGAAQVELCAQAFRALRPGGHFLVSTPSAQVTGPNPDNPWHVRELTLADLVTMLCAAGFEVVISYDVDMGTQTDGRSVRVAFAVVVKP